MKHSTIEEAIVQKIKKAKMIVAGIEPAIFSEHCCKRDALTALPHDQSNVERPLFLPRHLAHGGGNFKRVTPLCSDKRVNGCVAWFKLLWENSLNLSFAPRSGCREKK